jgi:hypothetical protein
LFSNVIDASRCPAVQGREGNGGGDILYIAARSVPARSILLQQNRRTAVIHSLQVGPEPVQTVSWAVDHGEPQHSSGETRVTQDCLFDLDFVVLIIHPPEDLFQLLNELRRVYFALRSKLRILSQGDLLQRTRFKSVQDAACAINICAADGDDTFGNAAHSSHQLRRLTSTAKDDVDHHVRIELRNVVPHFCDTVAVAGNARYALRQASLRSCVTERRNVTTALQKLRDHMRADESARADNKDPHN